jgi:RimK family alpha-L-glutamate ligase
MKKIILLNAGTKTRESFSSGVCESVPLECYKTKETILHISSDLRISFLHSQKEIDFTNSYVFTRVRSHDELFTGIIYEHLKANNIKASDAINISFKDSGEKIAQMPRLARANIQIPNTIIAREESYQTNKQYILDNITFPLVYKTDGNKGEAVFKVDTLEELENHISQKKPKVLFLLQELIPNTFDTRTLVAYKNILGTIKRTADDGAFLNNVSQGGIADTYTLTKEEGEVAIKATEAVGQDFGGVDIIHTPNGPIVLEVNKAPQISGFESIHGEQTVFKQIAQLIQKTFL